MERRRNRGRDGGPGPCGSGVTVDRGKVGRAGSQDGVDGTGAHQGGADGPGAHQGRADRTGAHQGGADAHQGRADGTAQVPRRKHLRGPDLDYTHPNTGQESQAKTVPSATAEKIQGLTNNPENFLCRDHRKCFVSVHLSVVWKQLQPRLQSLAESCALS